jgi:hypothetical protein
LRRRQYTFFNSLAGEKEIPLCLRTHREHFCPGGKAIEFRATYRSWWTHIHPEKT